MMQLPRIQITDLIAKYYGMNSGQVVMRLQDDTSARYYYCYNF